MQKAGPRVMSAIKQVFGLGRLIVAAIYSKLTFAKLFQLYLVTVLVCQRSINEVRSRNRFRNFSRLPRHRRAAAPTGAFAQHWCAAVPRALADSHADFV